MSEFNINPAFGLSERTELRTRAANYFLNLGADIPGGSKIKGHEKQIALYAIAYRIISPRDAASGLATGRRIHEPLEVVGKIDQATPKIFEAVAINKNLANVKLEYWGAVTKAEGYDQDGTIKLYTIDLTNAVVSDFRNFTHVDGTLCFIAAFTYQKITVTWAPGGVTAEDSWLSST